MIRSSRREFFGQVGMLSAISAMLAGGRVAVAQAGNEQAKTQGPWRVSGTYMEACNCEAACPCVFTSPPTQGYCTVVVAWHVDSGRFGDLSLDGLNAVLAAQSPGHMLKGNWKVALYVDERGTGVQRDALTAIFSGQAGGHLAALGPLIGQVLGVRAVPIEFEALGRRRKFSIPGTAQAEIAALGDPARAEVTLQNLPLAIVPDYPAVVARSTQVTYSDHDLKWELSEKNGFYSPFAYASAA